MNSDPAQRKLRLLVAPLDWGLGHATRCVPIIQQMLRAGAEVILAGEGKTAALLSAEFPQIMLLPLKGYNVQYGKNGLALMGKLLVQVPKILSRMKQEQDWLENAIPKYQIDAVISDNRYGLHSNKIHSVIITHQLLIKSGFSAKADRLLQNLHYRYLNSFSSCWVPDFSGDISLSGDLGHPAVMPAKPTHYIGTLSRFTYTAPAVEKHLLVMLSGPEPQRSLLEETLKRQLKAYTKPVVFVRGLPGATNTLLVNSNITVFNHLPARELENYIKEASVVIARTGYSTVMDLMTLRKRSILIPTPGQTEQEYLAMHLLNKQFALCLPQAKFKLLNALELAASFPYQFPDVKKGDALENAVNELLNEVSKTIAAIVNQ